MMEELLFGIFWQEELPKLLVHMCIQFAHYGNDLH